MGVDDEANLGGGGGVEGAVIDEEGVDEGVEEVVVDAVVEVAVDVVVEPAGGMGFEVGVVGAEAGFRVGHLEITLSWGFGHWLCLVSSFGR